MGLYSILAVTCHHSVTGLEMFSCTMDTDILPSCIPYCACSLLTRQEALLVDHSENCPFLTPLPTWDIRNGIHFYQCDRQKWYLIIFVCCPSIANMGIFFCLQVTFVSSICELLIQSSAFCQLDFLFSLLICRNIYCFLDIYML